VLGSSYALAYTWNSLAELYRRTGDLDQARAFNARALALRVEEAGPIERQLYRAEAGRIALTTGDVAGALAELEPATDELRRLGCAYFAFQSAWWQAAARWRLKAGLDPALLELLEAAQVASDPPPFSGLVGDAPDLAVAVWASGVHQAALVDAVLGHAEAVQAEIMRALESGSSGVASELLGLLARLPG